MSTMRHLSRNLLALLILTMPLQAEVTINLSVSGARDASGTGVGAGTLWAIVMDDGDNTVAGMDLTGNGDSLFSVGSTGSFFSNGQDLMVGYALDALSTSGDLVFAMGGFDAFFGAGTMQTALTGLELGANGFTTGTEYVLFWFPEIIYSGGSSPSTATGFTQAIGSQVGGISSLVTDTATFSPMVVPTDGTSTQGAKVGSFWTTSDFTALTIPEPTSMVLVTLGGLFLLRRRREVA